MLISFIITYHNEPIDMLRECIESILALNLQSSEREIVLVDDGSDTSPISLLGDLSSRVRYVSQENGGSSVARNKGFEVAEGDYIQFVDADDTLISSIYDDVIYQIKTRFADIYFFCFTIDKSKTKLVGWKSYSSLYYMIHNNLCCGACGYVFKRSILGDLRYKPGILHEDELFTPQLVLRSNAICLSNSTAYYYRQHLGTNTHNIDKGHTLRRLDNFESVVVELHTLLQNMLVDDNKDNVASQSSLVVYKTLALQRRVAQLTMDYLYNVHRALKNRQELRKRKQRLREFGLFPLPIKFYTIKYFLFSLFYRF